jgi:phenylacetate-CoA ligase
LNLRDSFKLARQLAMLSRSQWFPAEKIRQIQGRKLVDMLRYATRHVPYYRSLGISPESVQSPTDLLRFPILSKSSVQMLGEQLRSDEYREVPVFESRTSGSTGEPTTTYFDRDAWLLCKYALKIRRLMASGSGLFKHVVVVSELTP